MEEFVQQSSAPTEYTVVARRYRPKSFDQLIGQEHVAQALAKAIATGRVGHAYLFTGARGVGKTSSARIFAKMLNTPEGTSPDLVNEISQAIDAGDDMDVIEIDGASNRGINEIRQLRANVNVRPSRSRFKIYIIDEVHMLTKEAFNALLKTLEEPPPHVKFIFCTTDPEKIPITVLSRCQRFDFVPVKFEAIVQRLADIATSEGFQYEQDALAILARRAAGSMRDSQSLLEQVISFSAGQITAQQVHSLLGIADETQLLSIVQALYQHDALAAVTAADAATSAGSDAGQLSEQLLNYLRDIMTAGIGGGPQLLKVASPLNHSQLQQIASSWGIQSILSAMQILDESLVRMRASVSATTLLEIALVQICQLEHIASIPALIAALGSGTAASTEKKKPIELIEPQHRRDDPMRLRADSHQAGFVPHPSTQLHSKLESVGAVSVAQVTEPMASTALATHTLGQSESATYRTTDSELQPVDDLQPKDEASQLEPSPDEQRNTTLSAVRSPLEHWQRAARTIDGILSDYCSMVVTVDRIEDAKWRVIFPPGAVQPRDYCENPARKSQLLAALLAETGRKIQLQFEVQPGSVPIQPASTNSSAERSRKMRELANEPLIKRIIDVLDGEIVKVTPASSRPTSSGAMQPAKSS